ncbi:MAG: cytochrome c [Candidatus Thiodiazotropha sp. (ex Lucinoma borealis)]|nr:cytochrome c [Candidatus Thiodiazotropha sp. (ex Lucinoma borealis)]MCU7867371.1 cytochrome c [Candidatus Thiodiazotropha sp. (ex Lucinoma borealis)]MCU7946764.1 cytochrome c [Candidatus Thiodiazotropha sp. (ex Cardiolucina cf. quadrata)]
MKSNENTTIHWLGVTSLVTLLLAVPVAIANDIERAVDYRQGVMNIFSWNMKAMGSMMKGEVPFDQKAFALHASDLAGTATLNLLPGFPEDSESDESDALPEIWMEFDDFEKKYQNLGRLTKALSEVAASGDKTALSKALEKTGKACKACHKKYKN